VNEAEKSVLLSVIIPTFNRSDFLRKTICTIKNCGVQSLEIIVVDDGSTDDTLKLLKSIKEIRYCHQENKGVGAARNVGFDLSRGRYVAFLDSDDQWLPGAPKKVLDLLDRYPNVSVVFADALVGNPQEGLRSWIEIAGQDIFLQLPHGEPEPGFWILERIPFFRRLAERNAVFIGSVIMRREAFERGGPFSLTATGSEDWELWMRLASQMTFGYWAEPMSVYLRHPNNMSRDKEKMTYGFYRTLETILSDKRLSLAPSEQEWINQRLQQALFYHAYQAWDREDYEAAKERFKLLIQKYGLEPRSLMYLYASSLPFGLGQKIRKIKKDIFHQHCPH
jgi:glycosyltransferase involved in cell wall biosynthesis